MFHFPLRFKSVSSRFQFHSKLLDDLFQSEIGKSCRCHNECWETIGLQCFIIQCSIFLLTLPETLTNMRLHTCYGNNFFILSISSIKFQFCFISRFVPLRLKHSPVCSISFLQNQQNFAFKQCFHCLHHRVNWHTFKFLSRHAKCHHQCLPHMAHKQPHPNNS